MHDLKLIYDLYFVSVRGYVVYAFFNPMSDLRLGNSITLM